MDNEFKLSNVLVDVLFIFDICVVWPFIKPNKVVDVVFILLIDNTVDVEKPLKVGAYTFKSGLFATVLL